MKKTLKADITLDEIDQGWKIVRGMIEAAEDRIILTPRDRVIALKQIKYLVGILIRPPLLKGAEKGVSRNLAGDIAVIADIAKYGSLPKAVRAHLADGRLERNVTERSHIERIRDVKRKV